MTASNQTIKTFVFAPDSFKESMSAETACLAMQRGVEKVFPNANFIHVPMADGGEGTVDALVAARHGRKIMVEVTGPLPEQQVQTYFGLIDDGKTAVIEMANANGIHLLTPSQRNPLLTTTLGTGQMIKAALDQGVSKIIIGIGGSVTNDAGAGMAQALGAQFLDENEHNVATGGGQLDQIKTIDISKVNINEICRKKVLDYYDILSSRDFEVSILIPEDLQDLQKDYSHHSQQRLLLHLVLHQQMNILMIQLNPYWT